MNIYTRKLPTFGLYAAYADNLGVTVFDACQDEALNNLMDEPRRKPVSTGYEITKSTADAGV